MSQLRPLATGFCFLESPRWYQNRLWVSDFYQHAVFSIGLDGEIETEVTVAQQPSGLGWLPDGSLLIVSMKDRLLLRYHEQQLEEYADLSAYVAGHCNDLLVDALGRAWVGNFGFDLMQGAAFQTANLLRVDPDRSVHVVAEDLYFPNGMAICLEQQRLWVNETFGNRISAFDLDAQGHLSARQDWAVFADLVQSPHLTDYLTGCKVAADGASVLDAEGAIWVADALGQRVLRVKQGQIVEQISTAPLGCFACNLGGPQGRDLFLCVAPDYDEFKRQQEYASELWQTQVAVPAAGWCAI